MDFRKAFPCRFFLAHALALCVTAAVAAPLTGVVVSVVDGDTLIVQDGQRQRYTVRLAGIDAPERLQPFGRRSQTSLSAMVFNREVEIAGNPRMLNGRLLGKVMAADPNCNAPGCPKIHDVNLMQVMSGMAWWYRHFANEQSPRDREEYEAAEFNAKIRRIGLWAGKNPVPPWEWRRR